MSVGEVEGSELRGKATASGRRLHMFEESIFVSRFVGSLSGGETAGDADPQPVQAEHVLLSPG